MIGAAKDFVSQSVLGLNFLQTLAMSLVSGELINSSRHEELPRTIIHDQVPLLAPPGVCGRLG